VHERCHGLIGIAGRSGIADRGDRLVLGWPTSGESIVHGAVRAIRRLHGPVKSSAKRSPGTRRRSSAPAITRSKDGWTLRQAIGVEQVLTEPRSPWHNGFNLPHQIAELADGRVVAIPQVGGCDTATNGGRPDRDLLNSRTPARLATRADSRRSRLDHACSRSRELNQRRYV
jgi:hypothetical protein